VVSLLFNVSCQDFIASVVDSYNKRMEVCWSDIGRGTCHIVVLVATNPTCTGLGSSLGLCSERLATDRLNQGTAAECIVQLWAIK
jgi:hypothetical protein